MLFPSFWLNLISQVMVSSLEEMWKRFHLSNEEKLAIVIKLEEVVFFLNSMLNLVFWSSYKHLRSTTKKPLNLLSISYRLPILAMKTILQKNLYKSPWSSYKKLILLKGFHDYTLVMSNFSILLFGFGILTFLLKVWMKMWVIVLLKKLGSLSLSMFQSVYFKCVNC